MNNVVIQFRPWLTVKGMTVKGMLLFCLAFPGCSKKDGPPLYPVHGQAFFEGQPIAKAVLILHPVHQTELGKVKPRALVGPDGSFEVYTIVAGDGAPEGDYAVTVMWKKRKLGAHSKKRKVDSKGSDIPFPPRYQDPQTSGLRIQVKKGSNELPPFYLKE